MIFLKIPQNFFRILYLSLVSKSMKKFRLYVDEVGNSDLNSSDHENHRYLSLTNYF